jgi:acetyl-CoA carboxylase biotin carboxyl carrier protein
MKKSERSVSRPTGTSPRGTKNTESRPAKPVQSTIVEGQSGESLSLTEIKELIELVSEKQFNEFELERGDFRLRLQKGGPRLLEQSSGAMVGGATQGAAHVVTAPEPTPIVEEKLHLVTSPIVGTFYRSPSPTSDVFVKLGDSVESGKTLCIIEAMKLMNEIQSDGTGTIAKIFVENGQPVEYGQPLFGLKV